LALVVPVPASGPMRLLVLKRFHEPTIVRGAGHGCLASEAMSFRTLFSLLSPAMMQVSCTQPKHPQPLAFTPTSSMICEAAS